MFRWFKKKQPSKEELIPEGVKQMLRSMTFAEVLAKRISEYSKFVQDKKLPIPAYRRKNDSVVNIWRGTQLEALQQLWNYGASDAFLLSDGRRQKEILDNYFGMKPQYEWPHEPSNEPIHDTLQAIHHVYLYLNKVGSVVADRETDSLSLEIKKKNIFSDFEMHARQLHIEWSEFDSEIHGYGSLPPMPSMILDVLYKDVTKKSKSIALSTKFGPIYESGIKSKLKNICKILKESGESEISINKQSRELQDITRKLLSAQSPDDVP